MSTDMGVVAHAGGMGWDEALIFAVPVLILAALQVLARRKAKDGADDADDADDADRAA